MRTAANKARTPARALRRIEHVGAVVGAVGGVGRSDVQPEFDPQAVWWALEDLWLRLARVCPLTVDCKVLRVRLHGLRRWTTGVTSELRAAALDKRRFRCEAKGRRVSFARGIVFEGRDLVVEFTPLAVIERWPDGAVLAQQVRGFLCRLHQDARGAR